MLCRDLEPASNDLHIQSHKKGQIPHIDAVLSAAAQCRLMEAVICNAYTIPISDLRAETRCPRRIARARQAMMYLTHVGLGMNLTTLGRSFGRDRTTARYACAIMEDARDDQRIDQSLNALEAGVLGFSKEFLSEATHSH